MTSRQLVHASPEGEARVLCLIDGFSRKGKTKRALEGRTKLAKLDFLLRYPRYFARALEAVHATAHLPAIVDEDSVPLTERMVRYRYGPWDPQYFSILGRLIGKGLIEPVRDRRGFSYRTTELGQQVVARLAEDESYDSLLSRVAILRKHFDWNGTRLKVFVYEIFPEVAGADWGKVI